MLEPSNWRHLFRLGHASWGEARLQAAAATLDTYPDFAFAHFQIAMVHVARGRLADAETVLRQGAAVQDRQRERRERFPALGLHWLLALTRLADEDVAEALAEFDRELLVADPHRLYGREYAITTLHGRGVALLHANRPDDALRELRRALELYPMHAQSRLAVALAHRALGDESAARAETARVEEALNTLTRHRPLEAAVVRALLLVVCGQYDEAIGTLVGAVRDAPPGFAGWILPVEPLLAPVRRNQRFNELRRLLADRAR